MDKDSADYVGLLMSFGMGHRSCIGRNIAMMNILKVTATLLRNYKLEAVNLYEKLEILHRGVAEKKGPLMCKVEKRN
jgi:cytochrome P450